MDCIRITGRNPLDGEIVVQGSKNAALPIISASVAIGGRCVIRNCPKLSDTIAALEIIRFLGGEYFFRGNELTVDTINLENKPIGVEFMGKLRSSIIFAGALASRFGVASLAMPGGCKLGPRPIDIHIEAFEKLGFEVECEDGYLKIYGRAVGCDLIFPMPSVGATQNAMLAAVMAEGKTTIINAAKEPEIICLQRFLNLAGAKIRGAGSSVIHIEGVKSFCGVDFEIDGDRIAAATYMACAISSKGNVLVKGIDREQISLVLSMFEEMGAKVEYKSDGVKVGYAGCLKPILAKTNPYPEFPTDCLPIITALASVADGMSILTENIFEDRFKHTYELAKMGANIKVLGKNCIIKGVGELFGARVSACDLRGGASVVIAALCAKGETIIENPHFIDRGYENLCGVIKSLGGEINREKGA